MSDASTDVVAAVVQRDGRYLLGRRPEEKRHGGMWEFPGGKLDPGEDAADAARRELAEELSLEVLSVGSPLHSLRDSASSFVIHFHPVETRGEPEALEHSQVGWYALDEMAGMRLAPADAGFVRWLRSRSAAP